MKQKFIYVFCISICYLVGVSHFAQAQDSKPIDSTYQYKYGLRLGTDVSKFVRSLFDDKYNGIEFLADWRWSQNLYIAGELGNEKRTTQNETLLLDTSGSFIRIGMDYNIYTNWLDMDNLIYLGIRGSGALFKHNLKSFRIYDTQNQYWNQQVSVNNPISYDGLNAYWLEFIVGIKAELLPNLFAGLNFQIKHKIHESELSNFDNLYIPGFGRTFEGSNFGFLIGYNLAYRIPLFKKTKQKTE